jgi:V8-like Glu-specific endopeptidase
MLANPLATPVSSYNEFPASAIGRIFFYDAVKQQNETCSGTVITSANGSVVDTAGHCVYNDGAWHTNWEFCPQYDDGNSPYGCWPANQLFAAPGWTDHTQDSSEFGMAAILPLNGRTIESFVGGVDWRVNLSLSILTSLFVTFYGYPGNPPYDGEQMYFISRIPTYYTANGGTFLKLDNNDMEIGASGGPWLIMYQGSQLLIGHASFSFDDEPAEYSPYLNDEWLGVLNVAQNAFNGAP